MSESNRNTSNLSINENNDTKNSHEDFKQDQSNHDELIRDLTSESIVTLDAVVSGNERVQNAPQPEIPAPKNVVAGLSVQSSGRIKMTPGTNKLYSTLFSPYETLEP